MKIRAEESLLDRRQLLAAACREFGIDASEIHLIQRSGKETYRLRGGGRRWLLRVYCAAHPRKQAAAEARLLHHLQKNGVDVAPLIAASGVGAPEGKRVMALFEFVGGKDLQLDGKTSRRHGSIVARLHRAADSFDTGGVETELDEAALVDIPIAALSAFMKMKSADGRFIRELGAILTAQLRRLPNVAPLYGIVHGDHLHNARSVGQRHVLFDFDALWKSWRVFDISLVQWTLALKVPTWFLTYRADDDVIWNAFLNGYQDERPLEPEEWNVLPLFVFVRMIWDMGMHAARSEKFGSWWLRGPYFDERIGAMRQWVSALGGMSRLRRW